MADNVTADPGAGGATFRTLEDAAAIQWPVSVLAYASSVGAPDVLELVTPAAPLPITGAVTVQTLDQLAKTEDAAHASGDKGVMGLAVRRDNPLLLGTTNADGDYSPLIVDQESRLYCRGSAKYNALPPQLLDGGVSDLQCDAGGSLRVSASKAGTWEVETELAAAAQVTADDQAAPTTSSIYGYGMMFDGATWDRVRGSAADGLLVNLGANNDVTIGAALPAGGNTIGDVTISGDALAALQLLDDAVKVDDAAFTPASDKVLMIGATFDDVASDTINEGDAGAVRMSARRELYTQLRDAAGNERGANVNAANELLVALSSLPALPVGDNNIGNVDVVTLPALSAGTNNIGDVDVLTLPAIPAGTNLIGKVAASDETSSVYDGATALTPRFAKISAAVLGDNTLVAAVPGKKIRVLSLFVVNAGAAVSAYFTSGPLGTAIFADAANKIPLDKTGAAGPSGFSLGHNKQGWMETAAGAALVLNLSAAQGVAGGLVYVEV